MKSISPKRILYKVSGECLMGSESYGQDYSVIRSLCLDIKEAKEKYNLEVCLVVGGGNIYRGASAEKAGMDRTAADYIGMLATIMNAVALQNVLEQIGVTTRVQSALPLTSVCEPYIRGRALRHLEKGRVVIFAAGTGNPFFTTDTTATLRALEMNCDILIKGTSVDGIYSSDPKKNANATRFEKLTHKEVIEKELKVMDISAISLASERKLKIAVFSIKQNNPLTNLLDGTSKFTLIS
jgi:uridylate kinase